MLQNDDDDDDLVVFIDGFDSFGLSGFWMFLGLREERGRILPWEKSSSAGEGSGVEMPSRVMLKSKSSAMDGDVDGREESRWWRS